MHLEIEHLQENAHKIEIVVRDKQNKIVDKYEIPSTELTRTTYIPYTRGQKLRKVNAV